MRCTSLWRTTSLWPNSDELRCRRSPSRMSCTWTRPGALLARQVDLRDVAGDDDLGAEAEPRQEHLHLLGRGVLRLVQDDEAVVQRAAAHERERRHLDRAALHVGVRLVGLEHVVERVEQRAQVRVDLGEHVARQEPEPLAGLDRGAREDDPRHLALVQRGDRERHREVGLAGAGRADAEGDGRSGGSRRRSASASRSSARSSCRDGARRRRRRPRARPGRPRARRARRRPCARRSGGRPRPARRARRSPRAPLRRAASSPSRVSWFPRSRTCIETLAQGVEHAVGDPGELRGDRVRDVERFLHAPSVGRCSAARAPSSMFGMERKWWTLLTVCVATFMLLLDITIVNVALPAIERALHALVLRPAVGRRRLRARPRDVRADGGVARRPVRPQARSS